MTEVSDLQGSPLTIEELKRIEETSLSNLERHHLRLLAHCLASFKAMSHDLSEGSLPLEKTRLQWCLDQPSLANETVFISLLLEQFAVAGKQLEQLADVNGKLPLELTLEDLIRAKIDTHIERR